MPDDEIVKAYEVSKGDSVEVEDADVEAARAEGYHTFDITDFVPIAEIDPDLLRAKLLPRSQDGAEKVYTLLAPSGLVATGTIGERASRCQGQPAVARSDSHR